MQGGGSDGRPVFPWDVLNISAECLEHEREGGEESAMTTAQPPRRVAVLVLVDHTEGLDWYFNAKPVPPNAALAT